MKNLKKKAIFLGFLFILCLSNCAPFLTTENNAIKNEIQEDFLPKLNAEMLNLTTPENKTYFEPMSGHYPDPHSFTHEAHGTKGANIDFVDTYWRNVATGYLFPRIDPEWQGHKNYLSLIDSQGIGHWLYVRHEGFNETSGAMEWYWGMTVNGATHDSYFRLMNGETQAFEIRLDGGSFAYTGSSSGTLITFQANTWYHHRLLFDCSGAGNGNFTWIISTENGIEIDRAEDIEFENNVDTIDKIHIETTKAHSGGHRANFDAFGFSWEGYQLGDNLHEGLLISFKPDDLDWMAYSLDGQANATILGNTTIHMPSIARHTIQVFGNESLGNSYQSDIRYFTVGDRINIYTPENITYTEGTSGHYPDPHSFTHEAHGTMGANIDFVDTFWRNYAISFLWARIDPEWQGHKNYLSLIDSQGIGNWLYVRHEGFNETSGAMEWYWGMTVNGATHDSYFRLMNGETQAFEIRLDGGSFAYNGSSSGTLTTFEANTWYHHRLLFDCSGAGNGRFTWIISHENGTEIDRVEDIEFENNVDTIDKIHIETTKAHSGGHRANFDAFGFSWEGYQLGDNLHEGLLLNFKPDDIDWMGYSLDNQSTNTILGNTTIPMPADGDHTIQVFGKNSLGGVYESDIIHFTVDLPIKIITPESITYTEPMSGYYPATYGFENVPDGSDDPLWSDGQGTSAIISTLDGHNKVYQCASGHLGIGQLWDSEKDYGTIEFYMYNEDATEPFQIQIQRLGVGVAFAIRIIDNKFQFNNATGYHDTGKSALDSTWYHVRLDFETTIGGYMGLSQWYWRLFIDGELYGPYSFTNSWIPDRFACYAAPFVSTARVWDAVGYSWDPNYIVGDNLHEGLLLSYTPDDFDWMGYSLDYHPIKTILGNTTIPMPEDGSHKIRVFGKDSIGTLNQSDIRHFVVDTTSPLITINAPISDFFGATSPDFDVTITELNFDASWYNLNYGNNNTFTGDEGTINQTKWGMEGDGPVIISFYVRDTGGLLGHDEVTVYKDTTAPSSSIHFAPYQVPNIVNKSTTFTLNADDGTGSGVSVIRYKINDSGWSDYSISFDLSSYEPGHYLISYYSVDNIGNIETENSIEVILLKIPSKPPEIPGFEIFLLISIICIVSIVVLERRYKSINK